MHNNPTYTLSELCQQIAQAVETSMSGIYWLRAEISSLSEKGGHGYWELVEKSQRGGVFAAKLRAVCWADRYYSLKTYFQTITGQTLQAGLHVLVAGRVTMHAVYGLSFVIEDIDPNFTLGDLAQQRLQTLRRLQEEGVMEMNKSLVMPTLPQRIAVISAADAAGYGDFCHQLEHNTYGFPFRITLFSAIMQGDRAAQSIIEALLRIHEQIDDFQVVLILRGGGATADLACFDDYDLALYCTQFPLPIITGIGHTRDVSVLDCVAHQSVKTPTAAAEYLISRVAEAWEQLDAYERRLQQVATRCMMMVQHSLQQREMRLQHALQGYLLKQQNRLLLYEKTLALRSPEKIYRMGYSLTRCSGKLIHSIHDVQIGDKIETELADGILRTEVVDK